MASLKPTVQFVPNWNAGVKAVKTQMRNFVDAATRMGRTILVRQMEPGPARTGRYYFKPGTRTVYRASAPGQAPAVRTARYRDSWKAQPPAETPEGFIGLVTSDEMAGNVPLGLVLEKGRRDLSIAPRPHIIPAALQWKDELEKRYPHA